MTVKRLTSRLAFIALLYFALFPAVLTQGSCRDRRGGRQSGVVKVFGKASPAVVSIRAEPDQRAYSNPFYDFPSSPALREFFRDFGIDMDVEEEPDLNLGSGVIIDPEGHVLTNEHVVINSSAVLVQLEDGTEHRAEVIGSDARSDLAVLKIQAGADLPHIRMGRSDDLMIGEQVIAIGNPFGLGHTLTTGVISSLHRTLRLDDRVYRDLIQTDASINPGNSGGPLLNVKGELVGITTAIYQKARGIGFAIPIDRARRVVDDLIRYGEVHPGWLGIAVQDLSPQLKKSLGYDSAGGVLITMVQEGGPAESSGVEAGQIIEELDGNPVGDIDAFIELTREVTINDKVELTVYTGRRTRRINISAMEFPLSLADVLIWNQAGIEVAEGPAGRGAVISRVNPKSHAGRIGLAPGDLVLKVNQYWIESPEHFRRVMVKNRQMPSVLLGIQRGNVIYYTTIPLLFVG